MAGRPLHEELVVEILTKLPAKSLVRFKSLSKAYRTQITNDSFISKHFSCSTFAAKNQPSLVVFHFRNKFSIKLVSDDNLSKPPIDLRPPFPFPDQLLDDIIAYGPCNGIFCLQVSLLHHPARLMLWNPATKDLKVLPLPHYAYISPGDHFVEVHGFGVDPMTNDYKVVHIVTGVTFDMKESIQPTAQVYSLITNSWKIVDVTIPAHNMIDSMFNSYLNGVYHWLIKSENDNLILCFDMRNDVFWKMNLPLISQDNINVRLEDSNVAILNDYVAYVREYMFSSPLGTRVEIWVMNEYGVEESWTKRFNIEPRLEQWRFWGFWKDNEALIAERDFKPLVSYNFDIQQPVKTFPINVGVILHAFRYVESIVPLSVSVEEEA